MSEHQQEQEYVRILHGELAMEIGEFIAARTQIALLKTMLRTRLNLSDAEIAPFDKLLDRIERVKKTRDLVAHCLWQPAKTGDGMLAVSLKSTHRARVIRVHFTPVRVRSYISELSAITEALVKSLHPHGYMTDITSFHGRYF
ncbi:MAG TPA: hypothetical protein VHT03_12755 [Rhizomicrobium sp.]|jgi:hypothetical protein|nr:hypothetical protein [Rhizomicrobium sp.]